MHNASEPRRNKGLRSIGGPLCASAVNSQRETCCKGERLYQSLESIWQRVRLPRQEYSLHQGPSLVPSDAELEKSHLCFEVVVEMSSDSQQRFLASLEPGEHDRTFEGRNDHRRQSL